MRENEPGLLPQGDIPLRSLRDFRAVAETESIAQAAAQLHKAPSAISRSILDLEKWLGLSLFERRHRGMLLNRYGKAVFSRASRIHDEIDEAAEKLSSVHPGTTAYSKSVIATYLMSSRKLRLLINIAESGNMSAAASSLHISLGGATMALARFEEIVGQPLFEKKMRGLAPTEPAAYLVLRAKRVFAELRHMWSDLSYISGNLTGSVIIGAGPLGRTRLVPRAVTAAAEECPGLLLTTIESPYAQLIQGLRSGDIDIVIGTLRQNEGHGVVSEPLFANELKILARVGHPLARHRRPQLSDLASSRWVLPRALTEARIRTDRYFRAHNVEPPTPTVETGDSTMIREILHTSDMLAVAPRSQLMFEIETGVLVELPIKLDDAALNVELITRRGAMLSPAAEVLVNAIRSQARDLHSARRV